MNKVLLVDDDQVYLQTLSAEFNKDGEQVITAMDGEDGLKKVKEEKPDVVVMDMHMPKMLGMMVLERLMGDDETKYTQVIMLSNFGDEANKTRALDLGAKDFLVKAHMTPKQIAERLRGLMKN